MTYVRLILCALALAVFAPNVASAEDTTSPEALVDALNAVFGKPQGTRSVHTKGVCVVGSFTAAPDAKALSKAGMFSGKTAPAVVRFSMGTGIANISDKVKTEARGMAVSLAADDGDTQFVLLSAPVFLAKTPAQFLKLLQTVAADPATGKPDMEKVKAFFAANPESGRQGEYLGARPLPASYAGTNFFGVNTFLFTSADGKQRPARWLITPATGVKSLTDDEAKAKSDDFYIPELAAQLKEAPVEFDFTLQFPEASDDLLDPTVAWPDTRRTERVGRLTISAIAEGEAASSCDKSMFNPTLFPAGIDPSDDPILQIRAAAYAVSLSRRSN